MNYLLSEQDLVGNIFHFHYFWLLQIWSEGHVGYFIDCGIIWTLGDGVWPSHVQLNEQNQIKLRIRGLIKRKELE